MEQGIFSFGIKEQLMAMLQNVNGVNKKRTCNAGASSVCVTRPNIMVYLIDTRIQLEATYSQLEPTLMSSNRRISIIFQILIAGRVILPSLLKIVLTKMLSKWQMALL